MIATSRSWLWAHKGARGKSTIAPGEVVSGEPGREHCKKKKPKRLGSEMEFGRPKVSMSRPGSKAQSGGGGSFEWQSWWGGGGLKPISMSRLGEVRLKPWRFRCSPVSWGKGFHHHRRALPASWWARAGVAVTGPLQPQLPRGNGTKHWTKWKQWKQSHRGDWQNLRCVGLTGEQPCQAEDSTGTWDLAVRDPKRHS